MPAATAVAAFLIASGFSSHSSPPPAMAEQARQAAPQAAEAREAMQRLSWLAGQWRGTATIMEMSGERELHQSEDVRLKVFDTSLLIEGTGREQGEEGRPGEIVFQAMAVITYDTQADKYALRAITERGAVDARIQVKEKELIWGFDVPGGAGEVRYHIRLDDQGRWHEVGEFSRDGGQTWLKVIEMTLQRQGAPAP